MERNNVDNTKESQPVLNRQFPPLLAAFANSGRRATDTKPVISASDSEVWYEGAD